MKGFKAFNKTENGLKCKDFSFEPNKTYNVDGTPILCNYGFHFCEKLSDVFVYYSFNKDKVEIREVESIGSYVTDGNKTVTNKIKIGKKVPLKNWFYSEEVQLEAVRRNSDSIKFINNPSEAMQLEAIRRDEYSIECINNPSEVVQLEAVRRDSYSIKYIKNPSEAVQLAAIRENGELVKYIKNPSEEVQLEAVKNYKGCFKYIKNPTKKVIELANK